MKTIKLKRSKWVERGSKLYNAYIEAANSEEIYQVEVEKTSAFGRNNYTETEACFDFNGKSYAVLSFDHFNAHMSNFKDCTCIYKIKVAELETIVGRLTLEQLVSK